MNMRSHKGQSLADKYTGYHRFCDNPDCVNYVRLIDFSNFSKEGREPSKIIDDYTVIVINRHLMVLEDNSRAWLCDRCVNNGVRSINEVVKL